MESCEFWKNPGHGHRYDAGEESFHTPGQAPGCMIEPVAKVRHWGRRADLGGEDSTWRLSQCGTWGAGEARDWTWA